MCKRKMENKHHNHLWNASLTQIVRSQKLYY